MRFSSRIRRLTGCINRKLKGYRTAIVGVVMATVSVIDLSDFADLLPDGKTGDLMYILLVVVFIYMRHVSDTPPGWKQVRTEQNDHGTE